jgi:hypothetical protein
MISYIHLYILERLLLATPCKYVHPGLALESDRALPFLTLIVCPICLSWPTQKLVFVPMTHISHMQPSLNTRRLNRFMQLNTMDGQHSLYNRHMYIQFTTFLIMPLLDPWAGRLAPNFHVRNKYY